MAGTVLRVCGTVGSSRNVRIVGQHHFPCDSVKALSGTRLGFPGPSAGNFPNEGRVVGRNPQFLSVLVPVTAENPIQSNR